MTVGAAPIYTVKLPNGATNTLAEPRHARRNRVYFRPKNGRRRLTLPRPRLVCVLALLDKYERMDKDERKKELPRFDGRLRDAVTDDMAAYVGEVMSSVAFRGGLRGR